MGFYIQLESYSMQYITTHFIHHLPTSSAPSLFPSPILATERYLMTSGRVSKVSPILMGIKALQMMPEMTKEPALAGILFSILRYLMILLEQSVRLTMRQVPRKKLQERERWVIMPTLPYSVTLSIATIKIQSGNTLNPIQLHPACKLQIAPWCSYFCRCGLFRPLLSLQYFVVMDQAAKKKLANAKRLIQQNKYQQALEDLEIMVYKYSKLFQVHLMTALCYTKLGRDNQAEREYLEVLDLKPDQPNSIRQLCELYTRRGDAVKSARYLQGSAALLKKSDAKRYREMVIKLIDMYEKDDNLEKIDPIFQQYVEEQEEIGEDFARIAEAEFRVGVRNQCFNLQKWEMMGVRDGKIRVVSSAAREVMNRLLVDVSGYLRSVALQYQLTQRELADSLVEMKYFFPDAASLLMLLLFDQYCVGQLNYSPLLLAEIMKLLQAYFDRLPNGYLNLQYTEPQTFSVCVLLGFEYLSFFKEFFALDELLLPYLPRLASLSQQLQATAQIREDYRKKMKSFILKECRELSAQSRFGAVQSRLQELKQRILKLQGSFLQQVIAKIALSCVSNYQKINDLKNMLKLRIKNLKEGECVPHLYKYYYEYLIKIARVFKSLDEEIGLGQILGYITSNDANDRKYHLEMVWFEFCMGIRLGNQGKEELARQCLDRISGELGGVQKELKSVALRRIIVLKVFLNDHQIGNQVQAAIDNQRSFENLQIAGFYYYYHQQYQQAMLVLKQAFRLNQLHYHTNRLLFLCLYKCCPERQALAFLERIKEGFSSVFWINYFLAVHYINQRKYQEGQNLLSAALQSFEAGVGGFRYFYEKVRDLGPFSIQSLILQNDYSLFYEQLIFPQEYVYQQCRLTSTAYFTRNIAESRVRLYRKEAELLKILGRTKSALNYCVDGYLAAAGLTIDGASDPQVLLQVCLLKKEYATLLFYMRQFKEAEVVLDQSQALSLLLAQSQANQAFSAQFLERLDNQIKALAFQISVQRLSVMMRFQSFEMIDDYLSFFKKKIVPPSKPSLNFLKNKYQFHILEYMHSRQSNQDLQASISAFLGYFGLDLNARLSAGFQTTLFGLSDEDRRAVRECVEDYYIERYLKRDLKNQEEILHMLQLFPRSSALLVLFGMTSSDLSRKTAAFLKCIQMQRESTISIDILASLYLRQKNYLPAAKLFLKSLQLDLLNVKCYLGLAICLYCLICRAIETKQSEQLYIIQKSLVRINSYMEYLRLQDPSENYHILAFLKLLLKSESTSIFEVKFVLQSAQSYQRHRESLLGDLLAEATSNWGNFNVWKGEYQAMMVEEYLKGLPFYEESRTSELGGRLLRAVKEKVTDLGKNKSELGKELLVKHISQLLNEVGIAINLLLKEKSFDKAFYQQAITVLKKCEEIITLQSLNTSDIKVLSSKLKKQMFEVLFLAPYDRQQVASLQVEVFPQLKQYQYLSKYCASIPKVQREIAYCLMSDPSNQQIRGIYYGWMIGMRGQHLRKARLPYKLEILNSCNENNDLAEATYKKMTLLYRDDTSFLLYLQLCWSNEARRAESNLAGWIRQADYLARKDSVRSNTALLEKARRLKLEMAAYARVKYGREVNIVLSKDEEDKLAKLVVVNRLMLGQNCWQELGVIFKGANDDFDWWILLSLISWLAQTYHLSNHLDTLLAELSALTECPRKKGFLLLAQIISLLSAHAETQSQLVQQIVTLTKLSSSYSGKVSQNSEVIIQCAKCLLAGSWQEIQAQLSQAAERCRIVTYSDRVLINFFEVLKLYKTVESNPNEEGVAESFFYMVESMAAMVSEPTLKGFFLSLKGIIHTLTSLEQKKDRNLKMAMLLDPSASHSLLGLKR